LRGHHAQEGEETRTAEDDQAESQR
jgi:hypothetical protein